MNYTENVIVPERTLLVSLDTGEYDAEESLRELWELAKSGGAEPIATMMQKRPSPETATCVGSGMVEEIRNFCENNEIELIIFDRELTPTQIRNLENATDVRVVDRTMLILDIFAQRAQSRAGKVQVLTLDSYLTLLITCIAALSPDIVIHRVTGDGPKSLLIAPDWSRNKRNVLNTLHQRMKLSSIRQGQCYESGTFDSLQINCTVHAGQGHISPDHSADQ